MFNPKAALARQQSPYIIKRHGPRGDEASDPETAAIPKPKHAQQQRPLSPPPSYLKPKGKGKQLIAHPKLQTTNLRTSSPHVVKRAHSQVAGSVRSESTSGSGGSDETPTPTTPAPPYDRAAPRSRTPVSPAATTTTFHTARDGNNDDDEGTLSGHGHPNYGKPMEWTSYEYPTPPASASLPSVPQLNIPSTPRESGSFSSESASIDFPTSPAVHPRANGNPHFQFEARHPNPRHTYHTSHPSYPPSHPSPVRELPEPLSGVSTPLPNANKTLPPLPLPSIGLLPALFALDGAGRPPPSPGYPTPEFSLTLTEVQAQGWARDTRARRRSVESVDTILGVAEQGEGEGPIEGRTLRGKGSVKSAMSRLFHASAAKSSGSCAEAGEAGEHGEHGEAVVKSKQSVRSLPFLRRKKHSTTSNASAAHSSASHASASHSSATHASGSTSASAQTSASGHSKTPSAERGFRAQALALARTLKPKTSAPLLAQRHAIELPATALFSDHELFQERALPGAADMQEASEMVVVGEDGRRVRFGDLFDREGGVFDEGGGRTVVCFIRHFWCPLCQDYMASIVRTLTPAILVPSRTRLIIISNGSHKMIKSYNRIFASPFPLYIDPSPGNDLYHAMGMTLRTLDGGTEEEKGAYVRHGAVGGIAMVVGHAAKARVPVWNPGGDISQLGGEFVLGPGRYECTYAHRMRNTRAHADIGEVLRAAGVDTRKLAGDIGRVGSEVERRVQLRLAESRRASLESLRSRSVASGWVEEGGDGDVCASEVCERVPSPVSTHSSSFSKQRGKAASQAPSSYPTASPPSEMYTPTASTSFPGFPIPSSSSRRPRTSGDRPRTSGDRPRTSGDRQRTSGERPRIGGDRPGTAQSTATLTADSSASQFTFGASSSAPPQRAPIPPASGHKHRRSSSFTQKRPTGPLFRSLHDPFPELSRPKTSDGLRMAPGELPLSRGREGQVTLKLVQGAWVRTPAGEETETETEAETDTGNETETDAGNETEMETEEGMTATASSIDHSFDHADIHGRFAQMDELDELSDSDDEGTLEGEVHVAARVRMPDVNLARFKSRESFAMR